MAGLVQSIGIADDDPGTLSRGGERASGPRRADGGDVGPSRRRLGHRGPRFDQPVGRGGYAWWYVDALSADGAHGLTIIAFIGSVFSPYYAVSRAWGAGDPSNHVAMNVALYGKPARWAMTERGAASLDRGADHIAIGASGMRWDGAKLVIDVNERTAPMPRRLRGTVTVTPRALTDQAFELDARGRHRWQPLAPLCDVAVAFDSPGMAWRGTGYFDTNDGDEPLEDAFRSWTWSRFDMADHARIVYDVVERDGLARGLSLRVGASGAIETAATLAATPLPKGLWGVERSAPADAGATPELLGTFEDAPFYTRSKIRSRIDGVEATGVNESLTLARLRAPWVRTLLPFRMPRSAAHGGMGR
jgi:carotenoid 1,2-hydratase